MEVLLPHITKWFLGKEEHFKIFAQADCRLEGWFKAELLVLLNRFMAQGVVENFEREANISSPRNGTRKQVDFKIIIQGQEHLCELKALCISQAAGTPRNLHFYFRDDQVGLIKDFKKLDEICKQYKWVLAFIYPAPDLKEWHKINMLLPVNLRHWISITSPDNYPRWIYIALWKGDM